GLGTVIYLIFNGAVLGSSIQTASKFQDMDISEIVLALLPHGIFEIPAMIISGLIGFQIIEYLLLFFSNNISVLIKDFLKQLLLRIIIVLILTTLAGVIEWYITFKFFKGDYL
ncbi:stage II sporulation protein M, partial [Staphylococcus felis]